MAGGTLGRADLYGIPTQPSRDYSPITVTNPNGDSVAPMTQTASGGGVSTGNGPALSLVGLIGALVVLRVLLHLAKAD